MRISRCTCVVRDCPTNCLSESDREQEKFFCFPKDDDRRNEWVIKLQREDLRGKSFSCMKNFVVCKLHFSEHHFRTADLRKLNTNASPNEVCGNRNAACKDEVRPCNENISQPLQLPAVPSPLASTSTQLPLPTVPSPLVSTPTHVPCPSPKRSAQESIPCSLDFTPTKRPRFEYPVRSRRNVRLRDLGATRLVQLTPRKKSMYTRLRQIERSITTLKRRRVIRAKTSKYLNNLTDLPKPLKMFFSSQLRNYLKTKKARRYTLKEKSMFLSIYKHSPKCYRYLQKLLSLPCSRTLRQVCSSFNLKPGINFRLFRYMSRVSERENERDRYCVLMFDEMELDKHLNLVVGKNTCRVEGFVNLEGEESDRRIADHALVFMIRGIRRRWKQPVAYYFTKNCASGETLKGLIINVIRSIHANTNYKVVASVSDGGSWNVAAIRLLARACGKEPDTFEYNVDGNKIFHLFDAPHLLKCIRNGFIDRNIVFDGCKTAKWADIRTVYFQDGELPTAKVSKLTRKHVEPSHREKMRVKTAAQVFSHTTSVQLVLLKRYGVITEGHTAEFVDWMNNLFDSLNSVYKSANPYGSRLTDSSPHLEFWKSAKDRLRSLSFFVENKGKVSTPASVRLATCTVSNVEYLWRFLRSVGFKFLITRALNQDPVENFFSAVRGLCGSNTRPTCSQFASAYKTCVLNNSVKSSTGTNCEDDGESFLFTYDVLLSTEEIISESDNPLPSTSRSSTSTCAPPVFPTNAFTYDAINTAPSMVNRMGDLVGSYIAGFLLKKLLYYECQSCKQFLETDTRTDIHNMIRLKEYDELSDHLRYPSELFVQFVNQSKDEIFRQIPLLIHRPDFFSRLTQSNYSIPFHFCSEHGVLFQGNAVNLLCLVMVRHFVKMVNLKIHNKDSRPNEIIDDFLRTH